MFTRGVHDQDSISPDKRNAKPLVKPKLQKQTFNQALKGIQNLPKKQIALNIMTGKLLPLPCRSRSNSRDNRETFRHKKIPTHHPLPTRRLIMEASALGHRVVRIHSTQDYEILRKKPSYNKNNNNYTNNSRPQSPNYNRDSNRSRRPFCCNCLRNVRNYIQSLLDQERTDDTTTSIEHMETQSV